MTNHSLNLERWSIDADTRQYIPYRLCCLARPNPTLWAVLGLIAVLFQWPIRLWSILRALSTSCGCMSGMSCCIKLTNELRIISRVSQKLFNVFSRALYANLSQKKKTNETEVCYVTTLALDSVSASWSGQVTDGNGVNCLGLYTLQEENFYWNITFTISIVANSLNLNSAYYYIFRSLSMIGYLWLKFKNQNTLALNSVNLTKLSRFDKLNSVIIFIL